MPFIELKKIQRFSLANLTDKTYILKHLLHGPFNNQFDGYSSILQLWDIRWTKNVW